jgi:hypothetical protein
MNTSAGSVLSRLAVLWQRESIFLWAEWKGRISEQAVLT